MKLWMPSVISMDSYAYSGQGRRKVEFHVKDFDDRLGATTAHRLVVWLLVIRIETVPLSGTPR